MTATGHALIGTVIAAKVGNPTLAVPIAIASHFLADAFPHWDTGTNKDKKTKNEFVIESFFDVLIGFALSWLIIALFFPSTNLLYAVLIIIMAQLPDWLTAPYLFWGWNFFPFVNIYHLQKKFDSRLGLPWGLVNQVAILVALIAFGKII
ncbi:MAG TPA: hypothetical protein VES68_00545 [Candidatus Sulfotelmatobacter sp.]|nr:hypothetical protein [Candidatus Sulfotelmatobacter sp.]